MEFKLNNDLLQETSDNSEVSLLDWKRFQSIIHKILIKRFENEPQIKQRVDLKHDRLNFSCPYCGDSHENSKKKRGNLYFANARYKCYNSAECPKVTLTQLLKDFGAGSEISLSEVSTIYRIETTRPKKIFNAGFSSILLNINQIKEYGFEYNDFINKFNLMPLTSNIRKWLEDRKQIIDNKYAIDKEMNLWIMHIVEDHVVGAQSRSFKKNALAKYLSKSLHQLYDVVNREIPETEEFRQLDEVSYFFGWFSVDTNLPITVFEGPFDSFLFPNSIAQCSSTTEIDTSIGYFRFFFDNDSAGKSAAIKKIKEGYSVFMWQKFLTENKKDINIKDLNDLQLISPTEIKLLDSYFTESKFDIYHL